VDGVVDQVGPGGLGREVKPDLPAGGGDRGRDGEQSAPQPFGFPAPVRASICIQAVTSTASATMAHQIRFWAKPSGRFISPVSLAIRIRSSARARRRWRSSKSASWVPGPQLSPLHTHDASSTVHIEAPQAARFTLGQLFTEWNVQLTRSCLGSLGSLCADTGHRLQFFINSAP